MKIPITDQFLWDLYNLLEPIRDVTDLILTPQTLYHFSHNLGKIRDQIFNRYKKKIGRQKMRSLIYHLKKNNFIKVKNLKGTSAIMLTKKGAAKAVRVRFKKEDKSLKEREDGKHIMIIFDIPQTHRKARDLLRSILKNLGYKMFQHSVWITPFDVSEKTEELLQYYSLDEYVKIFLIERMSP